MFNVQQITSRLAGMSDEQLRQYAEMHKEDPYVLPLAASEFQRRKQMRAAMQSPQMPEQTVADEQLQNMQMPETTGIGALPAQNMQTLSDGGIAGYADGGMVAFKDGGAPKSKSDWAMTEEELFAKYPDRIAYREYALRKAREMGLDPQFVNGIFMTESRYNPKAKSKSGPEGIGQTTKQIQKAFGKGSSNRADPYKNIDASLGFMAHLFKKYQGDKQKVAVGYNQGEDVLDRHLRAHDGKLVPEKLAPFVQDPKRRDEPLKYLNALAPYLGVSVAQAAAPVPSSATAPAAKAEATTPGLQNRDVPGSPDAIEYERRLQAAKEPEKPWLVQRGRELLGAPEAALSAITGAISPATGTLYAAGKNLTGTPMTAEQGAEATTFTPRSEYGKESLEAMGRAIDDFKIPPYIGHIPSLKPRMRGPEATAKAATAAEVAADAAKKVESPRLAPPVKEASKGAPAEAVELGEQAKTQRLQQKLVEDRQAVIEAQRKAGRLGDEATTQNILDTVNKRMQGERARVAAGAERLGAVGVAGEAIDEGAEPAFTPNAEGVPRPYGVWEEGFEPSGGGITSLPSKAAIDEAKKTAEIVSEKEKPSGFTNEDILMMGLNMMMAPEGQGGNVFSQLASNFGRSGLATLQARQEREKLAKEQENKLAYNEYIKALAENAKRGPGELQMWQAFKSDPELYDLYTDARNSQVKAALIRSYSEQAKDPMTGEEFKRRYPTPEQYLRENGYGGFELSPQARDAMKKVLGT